MDNKICSMLCVIVSVRQCVSVSVCQWFWKVTKISANESFKLFNVVLILCQLEWPRSLGRCIFMDWSERRVCRV